MDPGYGTNNNNSNEGMMEKYKTIIYGIIQEYIKSKETEYIESKKTEQPRMTDEERNIEIAENIGEKFIGRRSGRSPTVVKLQDIYDEFELNEQLLRDIVGSTISMSRPPKKDKEMPNNVYEDMLKYIYNNDMPKNVFIIFVLSMLWAAGGLQGGVLDNEQLYRNIEGDFDYLKNPNIGGKRKTKKNKKSKKMKGGKSKKSKKSKKNKTRKMKGGKSKKSKTNKTKK